MRREQVVGMLHLSFYAEGKILASMGGKAEALQQLVLDSVAGGSRA